MVATAGFAAPAQAGEVPRYGELPSGHVPAKPTTGAPAFIPARERVEGFFVAAPMAKGSMISSHVAVVGNAKLAEAIRKREGLGDDDDREEGACFSDSEMRLSRDPDDEHDALAHEWNADQSWQVNIWPKSKDNTSGGVAAVHRERLVQANGNATLESVDVWVDPATHGVRLISRTNLALAPVGSAIGGVKVYAARDERAGARLVQFVVVRAKPGPKANIGALMAVRMDGNGSGGSQCGHLRMPLVIEASDGDSAAIIAPVELSSSVNAKAKANEIRTRDMQIHLSVSQTTRDKEPLVAVSFGWAGREQLQRIAEDETETE